jgi:hypothetical protein
MLAVVNLAAAVGRRVGMLVAPCPFLALAIIVYAVPEILYARLPTLTLHVVALFLTCMVCAGLNTRRRVFAISTVLVTLVCYGVGSYYAIECIRGATDYHAYASMEQRLSYEQRRDELPRRLGLGSSGELVATFDESHLSEVEDALREDRHANAFDPKAGEIRAAALEELHEHQVSVFVENRAFGVMRMRPTYMYQEQKTVAMPKEGWELQKSEPYWGWERKRYSDFPWSFHRNSLAHFLSPIRYGYQKDRRHVAGFQAHQFSSLPGLPSDELPVKRYRVLRLELVSLLTHDEPAVYVTENLPRMDKVRDVPVRSLDEFERSGLRRLWQGDDVKVSVEGNQVRLLGSIRAGKQCLSCHDAKRGDLLGAFSYRLTSEP